MAFKTSSKQCFACQTWGCGPSQARHERVLLVSTLLTWPCSHSLRESTEAVLQIMIEEIVHSPLWTASVTPDNSVPHLCGSPSKPRGALIIQTLTRTQDSCQVLTKHGPEWHDPWDEVSNLWSIVYFECAMTHPVLAWPETDHTSQFSMENRSGWSIWSHGLLPFQGLPNKGVCNIELPTTHSILNAPAQKVHGCVQGPRKLSGTQTVPNTSRSEWDMIQIMIFPRYFGHFLKHGDR